MRFEYAKNDADKAKSQDEWELEIFQLPTPKGDGEESYAAVRPDDGLLLSLTQDVYILQESPETSLDILNRIMLQAFNADDLRAALIESGNYEDTGDGDGELSFEGLELVRTRARLAYRMSSNPRRDPLGPETLAMVCVDLVERWSGKATGKPQDFQAPRKSSGGRSRQTSSSRSAKTRSSSSRNSA